MGHQDNSLDIIDAMLANEDKPVKTKKKKRGRPKGSKNKKKEQVKSAHSIELIEAKYVTEEEWIELGSPPTYKGYTTNRLAQWKYKTRAYYEVLLELHRAAIKYSKLIRVINWHKAVSNKDVAACKAEIEEWRKSMDIAPHEMGIVVNIAYHGQYKRKRLIAQLKQVAGIVLENRKSELQNEINKEPKNKKELLEKKKQLTLNAVANIPPNVRPPLKYVKLLSYEGVDDVMGALADLTGNAGLISQHACKEHPTYKGLRKPRNNCSDCYYYWQHNKKLGIKERRIRN